MNKLTPRRSKKSKKRQTILKKIKKQYTSKRQIVAQFDGKNPGTKED